MRSWQRISLGTILLAASVLGCASTRTRGPKILGSPDAGGLAIVEVLLESEFESDPSTSAVLADLQIGTARLPEEGTLQEATIRRTDASEPAQHSQSLSGFLVFSKLAPGGYALRTLAHPRILVEHIRLWQVVCAPLELKLGENTVTFEVKPGDLVYIGKIRVRARYETEIHVDNQEVELRGSPGEARITLARNPADERVSWERLLASVPHSQWATSIRERIQALTSAMP